jgi:hypothetical protein
MSRSRKKHPVIRDYNPGTKRIANRRVRRTPDIADGNAYRKVFNSWDIHDWSLHWDPHPDYWINSKGEIQKDDPAPKWRYRMK